MKASIFLLSPFCICKVWGEIIDGVLPVLVCSVFIHTDIYGSVEKPWGIPSHGIFTAVHCIFGCSALHLRLQCTESSVAVHCLWGCKRLWERLQTFAGRVVNVCA